MNLQQFIDKWLGKMADYDGYYGGQCVDLYRFYVKEVLGYLQSPGVGGATEIWDSASPEYYEFIKNDPLAVPEHGDIIIWDRRVGGGFGHVSIFIDGDVGGFDSFDQNWPTLSKCTITSHDYRAVIGWLRPKLLSSVETMPDNQVETYTKEQWDKLRAENQDNWDKWQGEKKKSEGLSITITSKEQTISELKKSHQEYLDKIAGILWGEGEYTLADENAIREKIEELAKDKEGTLELEDKLEREQDKHTKAIEGYEKRLNDLKIEMAAMELQHAEQIARVTQRVDNEIEGLQKQKEQYEAVSRFMSWINKIFKRSKNIS